jgi:hypothetical protein
MKRISTWICIAAVLVNLVVGALVMFVCDNMARTYTHLGGSVPDLTSVVLHLPWWPYVFAGLAAACAGVSAVNQGREKMLVRIMVGILLIEVLGMALTTFALCAPLFLNGVIIAP